jgi:hypothetical protein
VTATSTTGETVTFAPAFTADFLVLQGVVAVVPMLAAVEVLGVSKETTAVVMRPEQVMLVLAVAVLGLLVLTLTTGSPDRSEGGNGVASSITGTSVTSGWWRWRC